ncbi:S-adenosyl-L-methionine-dependent methyltransferase [Colletotrichum cereale]|nr:S-adenosyl-L-methionine-dependent methyltransferase [Colletotrichum cereale]
MRSLVETWYDSRAEVEERRLDEGRLEFEVTMRVIRSCIASLQLENVRILDIGGGPGRYAIELAKQGHAITLSDLSAKELEIARRNADKEQVKLDAVVHANALDMAQRAPLQAAQGSFDVVLCLGPLYHLLAPEERAAAVGNSISMAKPGGYVLLAYVSVYAHLRDMARRDPSRLAREWPFYQGYLRDGHYTRNPDTESFHTYPATLEGELRAFGGRATVERVVGCEGFLGFDGARGLAGLGDEELGRWVDVVMASAEEGETLNSADHLLVVLRKL